MITAGVVVVGAHLVGRDQGSCEQRTVPTAGKYLAANVTVLLLRSHIKSPQN